MPKQTVDRERDGLRAMNAVVEPLVMAGFGGPGFSPFGAVVLETMGRKTGDVRRTPLLATTCGNLTVVSTFRGGRSQWVKNLALQDSAKWWQNGRLREGSPVVFAEAADWPAADRIPELLRPFAELAWRPLVSAGWAIAVLVETNS